MYRRGGVSPPVSEGCYFFANESYKSYVTGGISLRNIVVLLPLERSQYSLFLHLFRVPLSVTDSGTLIRPLPFKRVVIIVGVGVPDDPYTVSSVSHRIYSEAVP